MSTKLTSQYLDDHVQFIEKNAAELGRKFADAVFKEAKEHLKNNNSVENLKFDATVELRPTEDGCVSQTVCLPFVGCFSVHVGV